MTNQVIPAQAVETESERDELACLLADAIYRYTGVSTSSSKEMADEILDARWCQVIPTEAVEAAARAIFGDPSGETWALQMPELQERYRGDAREAVEAAAPYIRAQAWDGGRDATIRAVMSGDDYPTNPYMLNNEGEK